MGICSQLFLALGLPTAARRPLPVRCSVQGPRRLIAYITEGSQGWILDFLWRDLAKTAVWSGQDSIELLAVSDRESLAEAMVASNALVLVMFQGHLRQLVRDGIPVERMILYFSHVRIGLELPDLNRLHAVLALNGQEQALLRIAGVKPHILHWFPAGYDATKFFPGPSLDQRPIDVLFVGRYVSKTNANYHERKRFALLCELVGLLVRRGLRVVLLGTGWQSCEYSIDDAVERKNIPHADYGFVYRQSRLVCSVSSQEGGPVSFLEGLASGCLMVSVATGFAADFQSGVDRIWHVPVTSGAQRWCEQIQHCLQIEPTDGVASAGRESSMRQQYLNRAQFECLALQLHQLCSLPVKGAIIDR